MFVVPFSESGKHPKLLHRSATIKRMPLATPINAKLLLLFYDPSYQLRIPDGFRDLASFPFSSWMFSHQGHVPMIFFCHLRYTSILGDVRIWLFKRQWCTTTHSIPSYFRIKMSSGVPFTSCPDGDEKDASSQLSPLHLTIHPRSETHVSKVRNNLLPKYYTTWTQWQWQY